MNSRTNQQRGGGRNVPRQQRQNKQRGFRNAERRVSIASADSAVSRTGIGSIRRVGSSIFMSHREVATPVKSTTAFGLLTNPINPGVTNLFTWGAQIANAYERYRVRKLEFEYVPSCPSITAGFITVGIDYDVLDDVPLTIDDLRTYSGSVSGAPWSSFKCVCDPQRANRGTELFTRISSHSGGDFKTYDVGNIFVATEGFVDNGTACGLLYINYEIELLIPQVAKDIGGSVTNTPSTHAAPGNEIMTLTPGSPCPFDLDAAGTTATFNQPFEGLITYVAEATGFQPDTILNSVGLIKTALVNLDSVNGADFFRTIVTAVKAKIGDSFGWLFSGTGAVVALVIFRYAEGSYRALSI